MADYAGKFKTALTEANLIAARVTSESGKDGCLEAQQLRDLWTATATAIFEEVMDLKFESHVHDHEIAAEAAKRDVAALISPVTTGGHSVTGSLSAGEQRTFVDLFMKALAAVDVSVPWPRWRRALRLVIAAGP